MKGWIALLLCLFFLPTNLRPCSTVAMSGNGRVLVANNKDIRSADRHAKLHVVPASEGRYGKMFWGDDTHWVQCGINEAGLFIDRSVAPVIDDYTLLGEEPSLPITALILDRCASVDEAVALFRSYHIDELNAVHFLVADRKGDAAVIEWDGAELRVIRRASDALIMTNFRLARPSAGEHPCYRYNAMKRMLSGREPGIPLLRSVLDYTHQEDLTYYSNIVDLTDGSVLVYGNHDFGCPRRLVLSEELRRGAHSHAMEEMFPQKRVSMQQLERRNGLVYEKDASTPFSGICVMEDEDGRLLKEGRVKNGLCCGCWRYYDGQGRCEREEHYRHVYLFFDSGMRRATGTMRNTLMIGDWAWMNEDGSVALEGHAVDGILYRKGEDLPYNGQMVCRYDNGSPCSERHFDRGMLNGEAADWYENGHLKVEGQYEDGRQSGQWTFYHRDGRIDLVMNYMDGGSAP